MASQRNPATGRFEHIAGTPRRPKRRLIDPSKAPLSLDGRRRYSRRRRQIEAALRAAVEAQGRTVDIGLEFRIGAAATAQMQLEVLEARRSVGEDIPEDITRNWTITLDKA